mmetsp:Transcript_17636/g.38105  ORF Transcript_17636/g.38105 Transcript_17636/m.38105 type:complete len:86 (-) Transcript_17636:1047-1304(-)
MAVQVYLVGAEGEFVAKKIREHWCPLYMEKRDYHPSLKVEEEEEEEADVVSKLLPFGSLPLMSSSFASMIARDADLSEEMLDVCL